MADNDQNQPVDLDTLTDEEFLKLDPAQVEALMTQGSGTNEPANDPSGNPVPENVDPPVSAPEPEANAEPNSAPNDSSQVEPPKGEVQDPMGTKPTGTPAKTDPAAQEPKAPVVPKAGTVDPALAQDFYTKVCAPFKADGREMQVRTPEDAIRLMQMGANYSRRMQEIKPMRQLDNMLKVHGLNDPQKLSFLIDVSKGKPEAIQKLLKDHKIDPIDVDVTKETGYKTPNYQGDPKDLAFQDAIDNTMAADGGKDLIADINKTWDDTSKEALREEPTIFENLLEQKRTGVYGKIKSELEYQRTMGFLTTVPFLQAYHQVGDAMQKAGVFRSPEPKTTPSQSPGIAPIDTGTRKASSQPKTETPNPNLSSTSQPRVVPSNGGNQRQEPDYSTMSDADFLKLAPPR